MVGGEWWRLMHEEQAGLANDVVPAAAVDG
jgi:hypothetical protein